ncbi:hypothetical protein FQR65_LT00516 [Abscondita terminalis]|nr:hypothetical protein FQR65_LT00516 [Abscondita terminalis]
MSLKFFVFCATLAIARAGYLQPALNYAHPAPVAIPAPAPLTYALPPTVHAEPISPIVSSSYGFSTSHTPVPAPIIRAAPVHHAPLVAPAPVFGNNYAVGFGFGAGIRAAPAPVAPLSFAAAPAPAVGFTGHFGGSALGFGRGYATGFGFGGGIAGPAAFGHGIGASVIRAAPGPIGFAGPIPHSTYGNHF